MKKECLHINAEDFLNAWHILDESNERLVDRLDASPNTRASDTAFGSKPAMGPAIVCLAFSVELYIKYLHCVISDKAPPKGHNILKLFEKLPDETRQRIFAHEAICQNPFTTRGTVFSTKKFARTYSAYDGFIDHILAISNGFEKWRYSHESTALRYDTSFALALIKAVRSVASEGLR